MRRAFTLIELLTVIGIIAVLVGVTFAAINAMSSSGRAEAGYNTIVVAVRAARTFATTRKIDDLDAPDVTYDGVALLFTPNGEMRLIENRQRARNPDGLRLEDELNTPDGLNGYRDLPTDYVVLPKGVGVVGITRGNDDANKSIAKLLAPPFAIVFNKHGGLLVGSGSATKFNRSRLVYYDANHDDRYFTGSGGTDQVSNRRNPFGGGRYDPGKWDPTSSFYVATNDPSENTGFDDNPDYNRHRLPFEEIESVIGVFLFDMNDLRSAVPETSASALVSQGTTNGTQQINDAARAWITATDSNGNLINSKTILFSRLTGTAMRE